MFLSDVLLKSRADQLDHQRPSEATCCFVQVVWRLKNTTKHEGRAQEQRAAAAAAAGTRLRCLFAQI